MNKSELIDAMASDAGISKAAAKKALDAFTGSVAGTLAKGGKVALVGFGSFSISRRAARDGRNPQTGATIYNKYTAEIRYALSLNPTSTMYALAFLEAGNAWEDFDNFNPFGVKRSVGIGVKIMLPMIGMMGLDYGWGLDEIVGNPDANGGQFHFSIGQNF